ncbi:hypothetical protein [uncultured Draconibacterium sp.]|uniref:hypothetical protein n=1 Tax=uncultured Draconibacterium sp. TaxID=1573823 RepID=UPI0032608255
MKTIIQYLTFCYFLLIIFGYLNMYIYYTFFEVEIYNYINITELALSFTSILLSLLIVATPRLINILLSIFDEEEEKNKRNPVVTLYKLLTVRRFRKKFSLWTKIKVLLSIVGAYRLLMLYIALDNLIPIIRAYNKNDSALLDVGLSSIFITLLFLYYAISPIFYKLFDKISTIFYEEKNDTFSFITMHIMLFLIFIFSFNAIKQKKVKIGYPLYEATIILEDKQIKTKGDIAFVGQTQNFIFLRNLKTEENIILKNTEIIEIHKKKVRKGNI